MAMFNASYHAVKAVDNRLSIGGPASASLQDVDKFVAALTPWQLGGDTSIFVSSHSYPGDRCNSAPDVRAHLDCFTDSIIAARNLVPAEHEFLLTEFNCGWGDTQIHDGESKAYAASFLLRTVNALRLHNISALSWWTFSSHFDEGGFPTHEFGPFSANAAMQSVHGVPLPIYRGFQLLANAGDEVLSVAGLNTSGPLAVK